MRKLSRRIRIAKSLVRTARKIDPCMAYTVNFASYKTTWLFTLSSKDMLDRFTEIARKKFKGEAYTERSDGHTAVYELEAER